MCLKLIGPFLEVLIAYTMHNLILNKTWGRSTSNSQYFSSYRSPRFFAKKLFLVFKIDWATLSGSHIAYTMRNSILNKTWGRSTSNSKYFSSYRVPRFGQKTSSIYHLSIYLRDIVRCIYAALAPAACVDKVTYFNRLSFQNGLIFLQAVFSVVFSNIKASFSSGFQT